MLETDDIEEDYFTPASSTTLANIFEKSKNEKPENESLKYVPPKPQATSPKPQNTSPKPEESKATECVMACALYGYEWDQNTFKSKGMLGFAILKIIKTGYHNIVLYDSSKKTLSCATITATLEVKVKGNVNISYYDNLNKYWSIYCTQEESKRILDILKNLDAVVTHTFDAEKGPPEPIEIDNPESSTDVVPPVQEDKESDTDSAVNKRTKMTILSRMASMGHSVLPPQTLSTEKTSDSSDTNDANNYSKTARHKFYKGNVKRNSEKSVIDSPSFNETQKLHRNEQIIENTPTLFTHATSQLVPVTNTNYITSAGGSHNEMAMYMSEQRVNNTELRINISKITDKVDQVLGKITDLSHKDSNLTTNDFQTEILKKLLAEYENKIKSYEDIIKTKIMDKPDDIALVSGCIVSKSSKQNNNDTPEDVETIRSKIFELQQSNKEKENKIGQLESEFSKLQQKCKALVDKNSENSLLLLENERLKQELAAKNEELINVNVSSKEKSTVDEQDTKEKIKGIINDTFHAISTNFEDDKMYSGDTIKNVMATIMKKVTIESLSK